VDFSRGESDCLSDVGVGVTLAGEEMMGLETGREGGVAVSCCCYADAAAAVFYHEPFREAYRRCLVVHTHCLLMGQ
jgi:hypothetical protein